MVCWGAAMQIRTLSLALSLLLVATTGASNDAHNKALADAHDAWAQGDYIAALNGYIRILNAACSF